ncbi:alpha-ketoglutarate transmembrane transporter [Aureococcus anophagefferens]|uniref:Alpha-ketoglutarate transmembrane transporter n=1 Tax=Aureococcus anophagefferens TaxID=44056 RepID=A0ABR1FJV7_AURAN
MLLRVAALASLVAGTAALQPTLLWQRCAADAAGGCVGGLAKALAVYPLDRAATRLEVRTRHNATAPRGRASASSTAAAASSRSSPAPVRARVPRALRARGATLQRRGVDAALAAALAGLAGAVAAAPVGVPAECCKRRVQLARARRGARRLLALRRLRGDARAEPDGAALRRPAAAAAAAVARDGAGLGEDPGALLRGLAPRVLSIAPSTRLFFAVFGPVSPAVARFS